MFRVLWYYIRYYGSTRGYYGAAGYYGYYIISTHGYYGTIGYYRVLRVLRVLWYYKRVLCSTHEYYVVSKTGYYRVLQAYAAEGMSNVRVWVRIRVRTPSVRYLTFLRVILIQMARAFAGGIITPIKNEA